MCVEMANGSSLFAENENDLFFFESDHLALRGNKDYCEVLKTIVILSAQREKLIKDYDKILEVRRKVLENPQDILEKIQNGEDLGFDLPARVELPMIPVVNFNKYNVNVPESEMKAIYSDSGNEIKVEEVLKKEKNENTKAWSVEEQKRLEELLLLYPPEPIERKRYKKIAKALGNRTVEQVTSRVQKYFLKLYKAGLPIPGRMPKSIEKNRRTGLHKHQRYNHYLWKPTTFFPEFTTPVVMNEHENTPGPSICEPPLCAPSTSTNNYLLLNEYHQSNVNQGKSEAEMQLQLLKRVKEEKLREREDSRAAFQHVGFKCDFCDSEPILGSRWHCITCPESTDFCTDCVISQMYSGTPHPFSHVLAVLNNEMEVLGIPQSDSESHSGSFKTGKEFESDSSDSEEFEYEYDSNVEAIKAEPGGFEESLDGDQGYEGNVDSDSNCN
ncbi:hypothetical protein JTB14_006212 [Gonioctena quinquepunctata]|nr:hypothetical protein JTB14_006212 [Gonioctena quinquepunctata]